MQMPQCGDGQAIPRSLETNWKCSIKICNKSIIHNGLSWYILVMANNPCFGNHLFITILGRPRWHSEAMEEDPSETGSVSEAWPNHNLDQNWGTNKDHNGPIGHISLLDALSILSYFIIFYHILQWMLLGGSFWAILEYLEYLRISRIRLACSDVLWCGFGWFWTPHRCKNQTPWSDRRLPRRLGLWGQRC